MKAASNGTPFVTEKIFFAFNGNTAQDLFVSRSALTHRVKWVSLPTTKL